jgi:hypothetical protein
MVESVQKIKPIHHRFLSILNECCVEGEDCLSCIRGSVPVRTDEMRVARQLEQLGMVSIWMRLHPHSMKAHITLAGRNALR